MSDQADVAEVARPQGNEALFAQSLPPGAPNPNGAVMKAVHQRIVTERQRLATSGLLKPATLINFNPHELRVESALIPWVVPKFDEGKSIKIKVGGRERQASFMTLREAVIRPRVRNVTLGQSGDPNEPNAEYDAMSILPIEIVWQFLNEYTASDSPVGGVLAFEGDIHVIKDRGKESKEFRVPKFITLADRSRSYFSEPADFQEVLEQSLQTQRLHCEGVLQRAYANFQDPDQRKFIHNVDRAWAKFALGMGWIQAPPEWLHTSVNDSQVCDGCGAVKKHPKAHACVCGLYYEPYESYMVGKAVPMAQLVTLPKEKLDKVKKEAERRRKIEAELSGEDAKS